MNAKEAAQIVGWPQRRFKGYPLMTAIMLLVLRDLKVAKDADYPGVYLTVHKATLNTLLERDWIYAVETPSGTRYTITSRGERAKKLYEMPYESRRSDGMCPRCCERPRFRWPNGKLAGYCKECQRSYGLANYHLGRPRIDPDRMCSRCHQRPLHICSTGRVKTYCTQCLKEVRREERQRRYQRWRKLIDAGDPPMCYQCKTRPVYYTDKVVYDQCYECYREYQNEYQRSLKRN